MSYEDEVAKAAGVAAAMRGPGEMAAEHKAQIEARARELYADRRDGKVPPFEDQTEEQQDKWRRQAEEESDRAFAKLLDDG